MNKTFSIKKIFSISWKDFKANWKIAILLLIPMALLQFIDGVWGIQDGEMNWGAEFMTSVPIDGSWIISLIIAFLVIYLSIGLTKAYLNIADGKKAFFKQLFIGIDGWKHFLWFLGTYIISALIITFPLILLGIIFLILVSNNFVIFFPILGLLFLIALLISIFIGISLQFSYYFSIENRYHLFKALKKSWEITRGNRLKLFAMMMILILLNILGALALIIGLFVTIPMSMLIYAHLYRTLDPEFKQVSIEEKEELK